MKHLVLIALISASTAVFGQIVNIPDPQFKAFLVSATNINTNADTEIQVSEANSFTGNIMLNGGGTGITDLTGIEEFTSLDQLWVLDEDIASVDLSQNTALTSLVWVRNNTNSITLGGSANLTALSVEENNLTSLDISIFPNLDEFSCSGNNLSSIDLTQNLVLESAFLDNNPLSTIDLSQNTALDELWCRNTNLNTIDLSQNANLSSIRCDNNNLTTIDFSNNPNIVEITCQNNQLTALDLSFLQGVFFLYCDTNQLTSLDLSNGFNDPVGPGTSFLSATSNPNLSCIEVDDAAWSTTNWTDIDAASSFSDTCICNVNIPDAAFKAFLVANTNINTNGNTEIECIEAALYTGQINCSSQGITDLTGVEAFVNVTDFSATNNQITAADFSANTALTQLAMSTNQLSSIDLSANTALETFFCSGNNLTDVDLSGNPSIHTVILGNNQLTSLNVANGNNTNFLAFVTNGNPNLLCVQVDDAAYSTANWTSIDAQTQFSEDCASLDLTETQSIHLSVVPNPTSDIVQVKANATIDEIQVRSLSGKTILVEQGDLVNLSSFDAGVYLLNVIYDGGSKTLRVVKK